MEQQSRYFRVSQLTSSSTRHRAKPMCVDYTSTDSVRSKLIIYVEHSRRAGPAASLYPSLIDRRTLN